MREVQTMILYLSIAKKCQMILIDFEINLRKDIYLIFIAWYSYADITYWLATTKVHLQHVAPDPKQQVQSACHQWYSSIAVLIPMWWICCTCHIEQGERAQEQDRDRVRSSPWVEPNTDATWRIDIRFIIRNERKPANLHCIYEIRV